MLMVFMSKQAELADKWRMCLAVQLGSQMHHLPAE